MSETDKPVARDWPIEVECHYMHFRGQMFHDPMCVKCAMEGKGWMQRHVRIVNNGVRVDGKGQQ